MNTVFNQPEGYLPWYPVSVTDFSGYTGRLLSHQQNHFANGGGSRYFSSSRYIYHIDPGPGLYNIGKRVDPHPMQLIGSLIDVYA